MAFARERWPSAQWDVQDVDHDGRAQVVGQVSRPVSGRGGVLIFSHLDTSLTGDDAFDRPITGKPPAPEGVLIDSAQRTVRGFGLGVAKGPAAAALVAFGRAADRHIAGATDVPARLLLAAGGTHRGPSVSTGDQFGDGDRTGVQRFLADAVLPSAAIVAKGGPVGVLHDEPGACYVRLAFRAGWGAVMGQGAVRPPGGLLAHLGIVVDSVRTAGDRLASTLAQSPDAGQVGACFGIGAVRGGQPTKADLVPAVVEIFGYLVGPGPLAGGRIASELTAAIESALLAADLSGVDVEVEVSGIHAGASTPADADVISAAVDAWTAESRQYGVLALPQRVTGWTGSTDGVVLRAHGIPTARLGPSRTLATGDGTDVVDLDELLAFTRIYERLVGETLTDRA